jgi:hypothetical protein
MSTTTQSITPSQNTVSYSTLNTDLQSGGYASNFKNRIINGAMMIDQRNAGASLTLGSGSVAGNYTGYPVDRFMAQSYSTTTGNGASFTVQQNAGSVTPPAGFRNYIGATVTSTQATLQNSSVYRYVHRIEGFNIADLGFGTSAASSVTLSFWVRSSVTGTFTGALTNASAGGSWRSNSFTYTINVANTWEYKTVTILGDTTGTWLTTNGTGFEISFSFGASSNFSSTPNVWSTNETYAATGGINLMATSGATFYMTGVQLEKGSTATSFDYRPYGTELQLCQRYCVVLGQSGGETSVGSGLWYNSTAAVYQMRLPVEMRANPTLTNVSPTLVMYYAGGVLSANSPTLNRVSKSSIEFYTGVTSGSTSSGGGTAVDYTAGSSILSAEL